ncbi:MAG: hypothetical protein FDX21_03535 [Chlorobium sp.]|nr:MAG: hypothetical protein FDX21_03535 [Chlorobium sp.]
MEQEVPVTIHSRKPEELSEDPQAATRIPNQITEISDTLSDAFSCFRESESFNLLVQVTDKAKDFIRKNPAQALLLSLGAGTLFGLLMRRKR